MKPVTIYIKPTCPYCKKALAVLKRAGVTPTIIDIAANPTRRPEMISKSGRTTVPQIFFGENHIGGCDDLVRLEKDGALQGALR